MAWLVARLLYGWIRQPTIEHGDIISFVGAATGAGITVIGAWLVSEFSDWKKQRNERAHLLEQMKEYLRYVDGVAVGEYPRQPSNDEAGTLAHNLADRCDKILDFSNMLEVSFPRYLHARYDILAGIMRVRTALPEATRVRIAGFSESLRRVDGNANQFLYLLSMVDTNVDSLRWALREFLDGF